MRKKYIRYQVVIALLAFTSMVPASTAGALTVAGQVKAGPTGPPPGATVSLLPLSEPGKPLQATAERPHPPVELRTGKDGTFRLSVEQPDFYLLRIEAPGFAPREYRLTPLLDDVNLPEVELAPSAPKPTKAAAAELPVPRLHLTGRLTSAVNGLPIQRGLIWLADQPSYFARARANGRFSLALPEKHQRTIAAAAAGFAPTQLAMAAGPGSPLKITLDPVSLQKGRPAFGAIFDQDAKPVQAARVVLVPGAEGASPLSVDSDQQGVFHFDAVRPGSFNLSVKASGFAPLSLPSLVIPEGSEPWDLGTAFLESGATLEGRVVQKDGSAISGARVRVISEEAEKGRTFSEAETTADEEGRFSLADQVAGMSIRLEVTADGFLSALTPDVVPPTPEPFTIVLAPSCQISGTVLAAGNPVAKAVVIAAVDDGTSLSGRRFFTVSEGDGRFLLQDVEPGSLILSASAEGYADSSQLKLALPPGERRDGLELHLEAGGSVSGTVSSQAGTTVEGAVIEALAEGNAPDAPAPSRRTATTDRAGHFQLAGLKPGPWHFTASHPKFPRKAARQRIDKGDLTLDFVLEAGSEVAGTITDEAGTPVTGARVLLSQAGGGSPEIDVVPLAQWREAISQADGSFRFAGVENGSYRLRASHAGFAAAESAEAIAVANSPVEGTILRLQRASSISGRLLGLSYSQLTLLEVSAFQADGRSARGEIEPTGGYHIRDLAPGDWYVVAEVEETGERAIGQVLVGEEPASLDLDFASGKLIERPRDDRSGKPQPLAVEQDQPSRPFTRPRF